MIRKPEYIKTGDNIGITAPSFGPSSEPYRSMYFFAKKKLEDRGYKIIEGDTLFKNDGIGINTDPKVAAAELMEFYKRDDIDAIISAGGGELMCETITYVDFEALKNEKPKWFIGYSDNTNFIFPLVTISGVQGIYGPCISGFAKKWELPEEDAMALLEGTKSEFSGYERFVDPAKEVKPATEPDYETMDFDIPYAYNSDKVLRNYVCKNGRAMQVDASTQVQMEGILLGGCVDVLANLVGTRFDRVKEFKKEHKNIIWVLECCELSPLSYRRAMWNFREAGWFDDAAGFLIGRPEGAFGQEIMRADQYNAVTVTFASAPITTGTIGSICPISASITIGAPKPATISVTALY